MLFSAGSYIWRFQNKSTSWDSRVFRVSNGTIIKHVSVRSGSVFGLWRGEVIAVSQIPHQTFQI